MSERIVTDYWPKPIPTKQFDWSATREGQCGCPECHPLTGFGPDEASAIADLLTQEEERDE